MLEYFLTEWPDHFHTSSALNQLAQCSILEGRLDDALSYYEVTFESQRKRPNVQTQAPLDYGWLIITRRIQTQYEKALATLDEFFDFSPFPVDVYRACTIRAIALKRLGREPQRAAKLAAAALEASQITQAPLRYHSHLGLVKQVEDFIRQELEEIL